MAKKKTTRSKSSRPRSGKRGKRTVQMVFARENYLLLIAGLAVVVLGYVIMRLDNQVEGFLSLYVAPLLILGGYLEIIYAIIHRPRQKSNASEQAH